MKKIIFASHTFMGGDFVVGSHHLSKMLAQRGYEVIHVSTPVSPLHLKNIANVNMRKKFSRVFSPKKIQRNLVDLIPFTLIPWVLSNNFFAKYGINLSNVFQIKPKIIRKAKDVDFLIIDQPTFVGLEDYVNSKYVIYRATDIYSEMTGDTSLVDAERKIIANADGLIGTSLPVMEYLNSHREDLPSLILENGVEYEHFSRKYEIPKEYLNIHEKKILVYAGAIDDRLDISAFETLASIDENLMIIIIGPDNEKKLNSLPNRDNIRILGRIDYNELPAYLQHADIGLLPLSNHKGNKGRSPMKLYEYGAAGLPVLVSATPEISRRKESFINTYFNDEEMIKKLKELLSKDNQSINAKQESKMYSWESRTNIFLEFLNDVVCKHPKKEKEKLKQ